VTTELELELKGHDDQGRQQQKESAVSAAVTVRATLTANYNRQRAQCRSRLKDLALHRRQEEEQERLAKEKMEREERLVSQVRMNHSSAEALLEAFRKAEKKGATITRSTFMSVMDALDDQDKEIIRSQIADDDSLFDCLDINHDGQLDLEEVLFGFSTLTVGTLDEKAELIFKAMDLNNNGLLDRAELQNQFAKLYKAFYNFAKNKTQEAFCLKYHSFLPEDKLQDLLEESLAVLKKFLIEDSVDKIFAEDIPITLEEWRSLVKVSDLAHSLVSPEIFVAKMAPQMSAFADSL